MFYFSLYITLSLSTFFFLNKNNTYQNILFINAIFIFIFLFGFRDEIGGDWWVYEKNFDMIKNIKSRDILTSLGYQEFIPSHYDINITQFQYILSYFGKAEWPFQLISLFFIKLKLPIHFMNFFFSFIFFISLGYYVKNFENKFLALTIGFPILILIFSVGFVRQSIAFSFFLLSLTYLIENKKNSFFFCILIGSFFHISILMFLPLILFVNEKILTKNNFLYGLIIFILSFICLFILYEKIISIYNIYLVNAFQTNLYDIPTGAVFRVSLNLLSVVIFIIFRNKICKNINEYKVYSYLSYLFIISLIMLQLFPTLIDRINYYLIPLQIFVLVKITYLSTNLNVRYLLTFCIISLYGLVLFIWLIFGTHSKYWLPYSNILIN